MHNNNGDNMVKCPYCKKEIKELVGTKTISENVKINEKGKLEKNLDENDFGIEEYTFNCPLCSEILFEGDDEDVITEAKEFMTTGKYNKK